jgi:hypothetical protein
MAGDFVFLSNNSNLTVTLDKNGILWDQAGAVGVVRDDKSIQFILPSSVTSNLYIFGPWKSDPSQGAAIILQPGIVLLLTRLLYPVLIRCLPILLVLRPISRARPFSYRLNNSILHQYWFLIACQQRRCIYFRTLVCYAPDTSDHIVHAFATISSG